MSLTQTIQNSSQKPALMTHVVAGFPSIKKSEEIVEMMDEIADVIEIQIPFSDPVADGKTMERCNEIALEQGFRVDDAFAMAKSLSQKVSTPLLFMTYYNIIYKKGVENFCREAKECGIVGLIVPDFPLEEEDRDHFFAQCKKYNLAPILVLSPSVTEERIIELSSYVDGFWYAVSRSGTTGAQSTLSNNIFVQSEKIKKHSDLPVAFAFGVSQKSHMEKIAKAGDMAVVGSAVQNIFLQKEPFHQNLQEAKDFLLSLR